MFGGFDLESCLALSTGDKRQALKEMLGFISDNNIMHLKDFAKKKACISASLFLFLLLVGI